MIDTSIDYEELLCEAKCRWQELEEFLLETEKTVDGETCTARSQARANYWKWIADNFDKRGLVLVTDIVTRKPKKIMVTVAGE